MTIWDTLFHLLAANGELPASRAFKRRSNGRQASSDQATGSLMTKRSQTSGSIKLFHSYKARATAPNQTQKQHTMSRPATAKCVSAWQNDACHHHYKRRTGMWNRGMTMAGHTSALSFENEQRDPQMGAKPLVPSKIPNGLETRIWQVARQPCLR